MRSPLLYLIFLWPFVYSNARLISQEGGTDLYSIFGFIGPDFRILEAILFICANLCLYFYIFFIKKRFDYLTFMIFLLFIFVSFSSLLCVLTDFSNNSYIFRASYELLCPFLFFNVLNLLKIDSKTIENLLKVVFVIGIINILAILHQFLFLFDGIFVDGDYFRGIFANAHIQAIFSYSFALFIIANSTLFKKFYNSLKIKS